MEKPCTFCGGQTPGYETNALIMRQINPGYVPKNLLPCCWACKKMVGPVSVVKSRLEQMERMCAHMQNTALDI